MKKKSKLSTVNKILSVILVIVLAATAIVISKYPKITAATDAQAEVKDESVLEAEFKAGNYGGVDFKTVDDVVAYYAEAYNNTKAKTAEYTNAQGGTEVLYDFLGTEKLTVGDVMIDGKTNSVVQKLVPTIVNGLYSPGGGGLPPYYSRNPKDDHNKNDDTRKNEYDFRKCLLTAEDVLACNVKDNGDGTITLQIQPKAADMSLRGEDSQGRFFEVLGDIGGVVASIKQVSFTQGDALDNIKVKYIGGTGTIKIDTKTKEVVEADYHMVVNVDITHASIAVIKDKSASLAIEFDNHYPADKEYIQKYFQVTKK